MLEFLAAYVITIVAETAILLAMLSKKYDEKLIVRNSVIASSLTLPFVWFVFPNIGLGYAAWLACAEAFAFAAETAVYFRLFKGMPLKDAILASFVCNSASFIVGLAL